MHDRAFSGFVLQISAAKIEPDSRFSGRTFDRVLPKRDIVGPDLATTDRQHSQERRTISQSDATYGVEFCASRTAARTENASMGR